MPTDIQKNGKWLMRIGLKYQGMVLVTMMFGKPIPIIGFLMKREQWNCSGYSQTEIISEKEIYLT